MSLAPKFLATPASISTCTTRKPSFCTAAKSALKPRSSPRDWSALLHSSHPHWKNAFLKQARLLSLWFKCDQLCTLLGQANKESAWYSCDNLVTHQDLTFAVMSWKKQILKRWKFCSQYRLYLASSSSNMSTERSIKNSQNHLPAGRFKVLLPLHSLEPS